ncbi:MAG: preprotein translocase subunit SecA, partial [Arcobacteraceae bacterium]|nr:preprotein translocase subunit SecA [Arcobacteraceae bacterium]
MLGIFGKIFGTKNDKEIKKYIKRVVLINALESKYQAMSDEEIQSAINDIKDSIQNNEKTLDEVLNEVFAIVRESSVRVLKMRHYDVQIIGGLVLNDSRIAEMKTGE